ncbi:uncharacterized protein LOC117178910 isoform X2 [Belonocnema kinseyi]|uniref:uncharacterized protein LOC117178910 isoform X2 n=1 Tax=Belonocnema kinseyi TaxID=2817044 RepID=UPI00143D3D74|nr:uncharacterized protein LOC117178910 isoform X2 [Belonocnema kinseyi]
MGGRKCQVLNCKSTGGPMFSFPKYNRDYDRLLKWVSVCGNPELLKIPKEKLCSKNVCKKHFEMSSFIYKRISKSAVPSLHLPALCENILHTIFRSEEIDVTREANKFKTMAKWIVEDCELNAYEPLKDNFILMPHN